MGLQVRCPGCSKKLKVADQHRGKQVKCPGCGKALAIGAGKSSTSSSTPQPAQPSQGQGNGADKIAIACPCGAKLKISSQHRGKRVKCPKCQQALLVPAVEAGVIEEESPFVEPAAGLAQSPADDPSDPFASLPGPAQGPAADDMWSNVPAARRVFWIGSDVCGHAGDRLGDLFGFLARTPLTENRPADTSIGCQDKSWPTLPADGSDT